MCSPGARSWSSLGATSDWASLAATARRCDMSLDCDMSGSRLGVIPTQRRLVLSAVCELFFVFFLSLFERILCFCDTSDFSRTSHSSQLSEQEKQCAFHTQTGVWSLINQCRLVGSLSSLSLSVRAHNASAGTRRTQHLVGSVFFRSHEVREVTWRPSCTHLSDVRLPRSRRQPFSQDPLLPAELRDLAGNGLTNDAVLRGYPRDRAVALELIMSIPETEGVNGNSALSGTRDF